MTAAADITFTTTPLSEFRPKRSLAEFVTQLRYEGRGARERFEADHLLIDRLHHELVRAAQWGPLPSVGDLPEARVRGCVAQVEDRFPAWRLTGEGCEDILARLNRHFALQQERWVERRRDQEENLRTIAEASERAGREATDRADREYRAVWGLASAA